MDDWNYLFHLQYHFFNDFLIFVLYD
jgi:hypothetical protein